MRKLKKTIMLLGAAAAFAGLAAAAFAESQPVFEAAATGTPVVRRLYVVDNAWSEKPDCTLYVFGSSLSAYNSASWTTASAGVSYDKNYYNGVFSFDIPDDASFVVRYNNDASGDGYQSVNVTPSDSFYASLFASKALKVNWNNSAKCTVEAMDLGMSESQLDAVLSNIVTCADSAAYGYNAYPQLKATIFDHTDSAVLASTNAYVTDFDYADATVYDSATHSYVSLTSRTTTTTIPAKIARLQQNYGAGSSYSAAGAVALVSSPTETDASLALAAIAIFSGLAVSGYFVLKKKRI